MAKSIGRKTIPEGQSQNARGTAKAVLEAQEYLGVRFKMVQCDNGREFGNYFKQILEQQHITVRHTRVRKPNDNAHIERFNRTMRDEHKPPAIPPLIEYPRL